MKNTLHNLVICLSLITSCALPYCGFAQQHFSHKEPVNSVNCGLLIEGMLGDCIHLPNYTNEPYVDFPLKADMNYKYKK